MNKRVERLTSVSMRTGGGSSKSSFSRGCSETSERLWLPYMVLSSVILRRSHFFRWLDKASGDATRGGGSKANADSINEYTRENSL